jgi:hypothetical protein
MYNFFFFLSARQQIFEGCVQLQLKTQARKCGELLYLKLAEFRNSLLYIRDSSHRLHGIQIVILKVTLPHSFSHDSETHREIRDLSLNTSSQFGDSV